MNDFGKTLRQLRKKRKLSQLALGKKAKLPQATISRFESDNEKNKIQPRMNTLKKLADALGVGVGTLMEPLHEEEISIEAVRKISDGKYDLDLFEEELINRYRHLGPLHKENLLSYAEFLVEKKERHG
jgi:transcriptional regulator with XRE-family HTH domain